MPVKLSKNINPKTIPVQSMKDGQLAEIVESSSLEYIGKIVMRYKSILISVGEPYEQSWTAILDSLTATMKVRILESGEQITIV